MLDFELAGLASRAVAKLIDVLIQGAILFALLLVVGLAIADTAGVVIGIIGVALVVLGYPVLCETLLRGRSPGKMAFGLRVVTVEGEQIGRAHV